MANRLGYVLLLTALTGSVLVTACGDDDAINGGEAGEPGVSGSAGKGGSGGSGVSGSSVGGQGTDPVGGGGNAGERSGGTAGTNGEAGGGGDGQAGASGGDGGAGGAPEPSLVYACGKANIALKYCSAAASVTCDVTTSCSDCVDDVAAERDPYLECATCLAWWDKGYQCGIDAFESGNTSEGLVCYEDGVFLADPCYEPQLMADDCNDYFDVNGTCPATWPLP